MRLHDIVSKYGKTTIDLDRLSIVEPLATDQGPVSLVVVVDGVRIRFVFSLVKSGEQSREKLVEAWRSQK